jgi:hypothetical protein
VALHSYLAANRVPPRLAEALAFLRERQADASAVSAGRGWTVNTSGDRTVLESTSLIVRVLGGGHLAFMSGGPDAAAGLDWIRSNQNPDGGWGSFLGQRSRVWLTAMAIRAVTEVSLNDPAVMAGVEWLLRSRDPQSSAWGEQPQSSATITHTSFVLTCLTESRSAESRPHVRDAIRKGFAWLEGQIDPDVLYDEAARLETYNVVYEQDGHVRTWQNAIWHASLPYALGALLRHPDGVEHRLVMPVVQKIVDAQLPDGRWPNADGAAGISVWAVWPFVEALTDFLNRSPAHHDDVMSWHSQGVVVITRARRGAASLPALALAEVLRGSRTFLARHWASLLLGTTLAVGLVLTLLNHLERQDFLFALALPIVLLAVQELVSRNSG